MLFSARNPRYRRHPFAHIELVANADRPAPGSLPINQAAVDAVRAAWLPVLPGQPVPMVDEDAGDGLAPWGADGETGPGAGRDDDAGRSTIESRGSTDAAGLLWDGTADGSGV